MSKYKNFSYQDLPFKNLDSKEPIKLFIDKSLTSKSRTGACKAEPDTVIWIEHFESELETSEPIIFFDLGANVGPYSLLASKIHKDRIRVYSFEPSFASFYQLSINVNINNMTNIIPFQIAISDEKKLDTFYYSSICPGTAEHSISEPIDDHGKTFEPIYQQQMMTYDLDTLIKDFNLPIPNYLKIDVDGIELRILEGAKKTLENHLVKEILCETHISRIAMIKNFLEKYNFKIISQREKQNNEISNYIFRKEL